MKIKEITIGYAEYIDAFIEGKDDEVFTSLELQEIIGEAGYDATPEKVLKHFRANHGVYGSGSGRRAYYGTKKAIKNLESHYKKIKGKINED